MTNIDTPRSKWHRITYLLPVLAPLMVGATYALFYSQLLLCTPQNLSSSQFHGQAKVGKIGPLECCWTTSFGVRPDKELCGLKPLYSSLNNRIFSFASSSERNQLTFKHSSRKLPLKDSMNGLSVGFPGREKSSVTWLS